GHTDCKSVLRLNEPAIPGEATSVFVQCDTCGKRRSITRAFGRDGRYRLPVCRGRRPHLRDVESAGCREPLRAILLGASNTWFPVTLSAFAIPTATGKLQQLVESAWTVLEKAVSIEVLRAFRQINQLPSLAAFTDEEIWAAVEAHRLGQDEVTAETVSLRAPEWAVLSQPDPLRNGVDFRLIPVEAPIGYRALIDQVVLAERLREVRALVGFTRIESPGDLADVADFPRDRVAPLTRKQPQWVPAYDVRGEGIFIRFNEDAIEAWELGAAVREWETVLRTAHRDWRKMRFLDPQTGFPGMRYVLLHSFSHALMRQLVLECGYTAASLSERIYARPVDVEDGPMAGVLIYTAAPDSEGTLGGLVSLGQPEILGRHVRDA
ncbi:MAG: DrmB family protein, partial [Chloroflexota bacterium]